MLLYVTHHITIVTCSFIVWRKKKRYKIRKNKEKEREIKIKYHSFKYTMI